MFTISKISTHARELNKEQHSTRYSKIIETLRLSSQSGSNLPEFLVPSAGSNGTINPSTVQTVTQSATTVFTVTPNTGYTANVGGTCGGTPVSGTSTFTYTTNAITADCTVVVTFTASSSGGTDDIVQLQHTSTATVGAGAGNDTYLLAPNTLTGSENLTISDTQGANILQLAGGLSITKSEVAATALYSGPCIQDSSLSWFKHEEMKR
ncbi:hypothetical protein CCP4SC76_7680002 [Gammaproteobacteria bacterium]